MKTLQRMRTGLLILATLWVPQLAVAAAGSKMDKVVEGGSTTLSVVGVTQSAGNLTANQTGVDTDMCWKSSYGRGVAGVPNNCGPEEFQAGLCYPKCDPGYKGVGVVCYKECPPGYRDDGLTCAKPGGAFTRPAFLRESLAAATFKSSTACTNGEFFDPRNGGECWTCPDGMIRGLEPVTSGRACYRGFDTAPATFRHKTSCGGGEFFDPRNGGECWSCPSGYNRTAYAVTDAKACSRASNENPECTAWAKNNFGTDSCEEIAGLLYPKPAKGAHCTALTCAQDCPAGYRDDGLYCAKLNRGRPVSKNLPQCPPGQQNQAGLCYNACKGGYDGVGAVCWGRCFGDFPFECGAGCAKSELACAMAVTSQVVGVLDVVVTTIETAGSLGAGTAVNAAIKTAIKDGIKQLVKDLMSSATKKFGKDVVKKELKKEVVKLAKGSGQTILENQQDNLVNLMTGDDFDPTTLDPTGISGMVMSFVKPICGSPELLASPVQKPGAVYAAPKPQFELASQTAKSCLTAKGGQAVALGACGAADGSSRWMAGPNNTLSPAGFDRACLTANGAALTLTQCNNNIMGRTMPAQPAQMWQFKDGLVMSALGTCLAVVPGKTGNTMIAMPCNPTQATQKWTATLLK